MSFLSDQHEQDDHQWISISDLMSGLMVIFLFIAIFYIRPILMNQEQIRSILDAWEKSEINIYKALNEEFSDDLKRWNAELDPDDLTIRFKAPDVLFAQAESTLQPLFQDILDDFFPRYARVLSHFEEAIDEVRIEGHTSSEWAPGMTIDEAYIKNMELSQERTRAVLAYVLANSELDKYRNWIRSTVTANGLSSSRPIRDTTSAMEDPDGSRRVEFRVRTKAKDRIVEVLETLR